jgi:hypothetical protein
MKRVLVRVSIAAAMLSLLVHFYIRFRGSTYTVEHGANAFDVTLWRMTDPGWYLTAHILPHEYTDMCCYDAEILDRRVWVVPALAMSLNAFFWSAAASGVTFVVLRARNQRRLPTI